MLQIAYLTSVEGSFNAIKVEKLLSDEDMVVA